MPYKLPLPIPFTIGNKLKNELPPHRTRNREVKFQTIETIERLEIGYAILPAFWYHGIGSEFATTCKNYAFENDLAPSLCAMIHVENTSAEKVALKNGMPFEKN